MMADFLQHLAINEDVEAEFIYWKSQFLLSASIAVGFGITTGLLIAAWPQGAGDPELRAFMRGFWTLFVECGFWLGFLVGLLWGAAKRLSSGLSGVLPWLPHHCLTRKAAIARRAAEFACCLSMVGICLWIAGQVAAKFSGATQIAAALAMPMQLSFIIAVPCAILAVIMRNRPPGDSATLRRDGQP